jgi:lipopolysaccharide export LptBFGC system permease protein LptF
MILDSYILWLIYFSGLLVFFCLFGIQYGADQLVQNIDGIQAK